MIESSTYWSGIRARVGTCRHISFFIFIIKKVLYLPYGQYRRTDLLFSVVVYRMLKSAPWIPLIARKASLQESYRSPFIWWILSSSGYALIHRIITTSVRGRCVGFSRFDKAIVVVVVASRTTIRVLDPADNDIVKKYRILYRKR